MSTPVSVIVVPEPPEPLPSSPGGGVSGAWVASSVGEEEDPPVPGEALPTELGLAVESDPGTARVTALARPCGADWPTEPVPWGASALPSPPGWTMWSLPTGSGSKATPAMATSAPTATVAAVIMPMILSRLLLKYSPLSLTGGAAGPLGGVLAAVGGGVLTGVVAGVPGCSGVVVMRHPRRSEPWSERRPPSH